MSDPWFLKYERAYLARPCQNDAEAYGVRVQHLVAPLWRAIGVHHLTPDENRGLHNIYVDVIKADGSRVGGIPVAYDWIGRHPDQEARPVPLDKPDDEPGCNIPIWPHQIISVWIAGATASETVTGFSTAHPDENKGNSRGHHSFLVVFLASEDTGLEPILPIWTQLELEGLSYELTNAANAIGNAQAVVNQKRGIS